MKHAGERGEGRKHSLTGVSSANSPSNASYIVAYRFLEQATNTLEKIDTPRSRSVYLKLKEGKRELEDLIW